MLGWVVVGFRAQKEGAGLPVQQCAGLDNQMHAQDKALERQVTQLTFETIRNSPQSQTQGTWSGVEALEWTQKQLCDFAGFSDLRMWGSCLHEAQGPGFGPSQECWN